MNVKMELVGRKAKVSVARMERRTVVTLNEDNEGMLDVWLSHAKAGELFSELSGVVDVQKPPSAIKEKLQSLYDQMEDEYRSHRADANKGLDAALIHTQMLGVRLAADALAVNLDMDENRELG